MKRLVCITAFLAAVSCFVSANVFNSRLTPEEAEKLNKGEVLIRNIGKMKKICVEEREETKKVIETMKELDPNYTAEIIQVRPYKGNENLRELIKSALLNISDYAGIPYFSERKQKWYDLYDSATITEQFRSHNKLNIKADLEMDPFGVIKADINVEEAENYLYYDMVNLNTLRYHDRFNAVKANKMQSAITVFRDGDNWVLYAIGGVDTFKIFFFEERVEVSFINRIKSFCSYIFEKF